MPAFDAPVSPSLVHQRTLDNGLKVLVHALHTAPLVSVWCWYRVGSGDEVPGRTGVSHWVEHMNFKGTTNIPRDEMKGIVERFGGMWNGYTWIDQTTYLETAGRDALDQMLFIEAERMANGLYEPADCESERTVIISELQGGENDPEQLLDTEVTATAFRAHPYRHPTIGWLDDLQSHDAGTTSIGHYRQHYIPNNATLVVVGDVEVDDVLRRVGAAVRRAFPLRQLPPRVPTVGAAADRRAARPRRAAGDDGLPEGRVARARGHRCRLLPDAGARCRPDRRQGREPLVQLSGTRRRSARRGSTRPWSSAGSPRRVSGALLPTAQPFLYTLSLTAIDGVGLAVARSGPSRGGRTRCEPTA